MIKLQYITHPETPSKGELIFIALILWMCEDSTSEKGQSRTYYGGVLIWQRDNWITYHYVARNVVLYKFMIFQI